MKIFISYGHDHNKPIVDRIEHDLKAAGYEVWKDETEIKAGDHWRRSILDGVKDSDWVLGFLSKHSVRDPGVCLDELGIALHEKGGAIATVLLEGEAAPPVSVSHIQWLDMHDWAARQAAGGETFDSWYRAKLDDLLAVLGSETTQRFAGEIAELERRLMPVSQAADIGKLVDGFVGREWLRARLEEWQKSAKDSRLFWLSGGAGTGKSAFAAWLAHHGKVNVIGINLCRYNDDDRRDAGRVIRTLAFQIATRLPDYRRLLLDRLQTQDRNGEEVKRKSPAALFSWLLIEPFSRTIDGGRSANRLLVVIDGLDETVRDGRSDLAEILSADAPKLPAWIAIVVTSRPEEPIRRQFAGLQPVLIQAESAENREDVRAYVSDWLATLHLPAGDAEALLGRIVAASEGNFLYVRMFRDAVANGTLRVDAAEGLPQGLVGLYETWFRRTFPDRQVYEGYVPVLEVIVAAEHPVPEPWLSRMFNWSKRDAARTLEGLGNLFARLPAGIAPFHKSLRDWLVDPDKAGAAFVVDQTDGTRRLVEALWGCFRQWMSEPDHGALDPFCVVELPAQVARLAEADAPRILNLQPWPVVSDALSRVAEQCAAAYQWESALAWWSMNVLLARAPGIADGCAEAYAFTRSGGIFEILGRTDDMLRSHRGSLVIWQRLTQLSPGNTEWQRELSVSYNKFGDVQVAQGDFAGGLKSYRDSLAIADRLARSDPGNAGWRRDLSVSYIKVGDVQVAQGDLAGALKSYRDSLAIAGRLARSDPGNAGWQRDLSVSYNKIGDVLGAQGNLPEALKSFGDGLAIADRLAKSDPGNAGWQRDLAVSYDRVGDVLVAQGNLPEALKSFGDGLAIADRLAKSDPGNASCQRDLSVSYAKIGDMQVAQGDLAGALTCYRDNLAIRERLAQSDPGNARWQLDLIVTCVKMAEIDSSRARVMLTRALEIANNMQSRGILAPSVTDELAQRIAALPRSSQVDSAAPPPSERADEPLPASQEPAAWHESDHQVVQRGITEERAAELKRIVLSVWELITDSSNVYVTPNIPPKKERNAKETCGISATEEFWILFDYTVLGSAKSFMAIGPKGIFHRNMWTKRFISHEELLNANINDVSLGVKIGDDELTFAGGNWKGSQTFLHELQKALQKQTGT